MDDPADPVPTGSYIYASWETGPWQGAAVCGQAATLTRDVKCHAEVYDEDWNTVHSGYVAPSICIRELSSDSSPPPSSKYVGTGAGCSYHTEDGPWSDWSGTCGSIYRSSEPKCARDSDGGQVPMTYCYAGLEDGGYEGYQPGPNTEYDYTEAGCTYKWFAYHYELEYAKQCVDGRRAVTYKSPPRCEAYDGKTGEKVYLGSDIDPAMCGDAPKLESIPCGGGDPIDTKELSCFTDSPVYAGPASYGIGVESQWRGKDVTCDAHPEIPCCRSIITTYKEDRFVYRDGKGQWETRTMSLGETLAHYPGERFSGRDQFCPQVGDPSAGFTKEGRQYPIEAVQCGVISN